MAQMKLSFSKYHGAGNDFILIDNRDARIHLTKDQIASMCNRRTGAGADGLMYLLASDDLDFEMQYFNADGGEGTMCGNGGRCVTVFAKKLKLVDEKATFMTIDGLHHGQILKSGGASFEVMVSLSDVNSFEKAEDYFLINTGSPHYIQFVDDIDRVDVYKEGKRIRWDNRFQPDGLNVNFVQVQNNSLIVRTFERGVEDITLSCGTGVTAAAIAASIGSDPGQQHFHIHTYGGELQVDFQRTDRAFRNIRLTGPVVHVYDGSMRLT